MKINQGDASDFKRLWHEVESTDLYHCEAAKTDVGLGLRELFDISGITRAELARKLGKSAAYISKIFRGDINFTIESMVTLARALDGQVTINIVKSGTSEAISVVRPEQYIPFKGSIRRAFRYSDGSGQSIVAANMSEYQDDKSAVSA